MTITIDQLQAIFDAGRDQGSDEATSHDWNCSPNRKAKDAFMDAVRDMLDRAGAGVDVWVLSDDEVTEKVTIHFNRSTKVD